jgi:hypothetical protein
MLQEMKDNENLMGCLYKLNPNWWKTYLGDYHPNDGIDESNPMVRWLGFTN